MSATIEKALLDHLALVDVAKEAGVPLDRARALCAALAELPAEQVVRIVGESARIERCGRERANKNKGGRHA